MWALAPRRSSTPCARAGSEWTISRRGNALSWKHWYATPRMWGIYAMLVALTVVHYHVATPWLYMEIAGILTFIPLAYAALYFGLATAIYVAFLVTLSLSPHILFFHSPYERLMELAMI